jgi:hypothetical protein
VRYIPFGPELDGVLHVVVGGRPRPDSAIALSHLPGVVSPSEFEADTTAEIVLRLLRSERRDAALDEISAVTSEYCDADTLLGVWSLLLAGRSVGPRRAGRRRCPRRSVQRALVRRGSTVRLLGARLSQR